MFAYLVHFFPRLVITNSQAIGPTEESSSSSAIGRRLWKIAMCVIGIPQTDSPAAHLNSRPRPSSLPDASVAASLPPSHRQSLV